MTLVQWVLASWGQKAMVAKVQNHHQHLGPMVLMAGLIEAVKVK